MVAGSLQSLPADPDPSRLAKRRASLPPGLWPLLAAIVTALWLFSIGTGISTRVLQDHIGELACLAFLLLTVAAFGGSVIWSVFHLLYVHPRGRRAALPLLVNALPLAAMAFLPVGRLADTLDFQAHYTARAEVVRKLETGELGWSGSPNFSLVNLPPEYPKSVSNGAGQRGLTVYREEGVLHVVFYPAGGLFRQGTDFLYRADGGAPTLPNGYLPNAISSEPLGGRWWRVVER